jgi:hypothetical protein
MTLGAKETSSDRRKKGKRSPKRTHSSAQAKEVSATPEGKASLPSPTLLSIRKLLQKQTPSKQDAPEEPEGTEADALTAQLNPEIQLQTGEPPVGELPLIYVHLLQTAELCIE